MTKPFLKPLALGVSLALSLSACGKHEEAAKPAETGKVITHADVAVRMSGGRLKLRITAGMIEQLQFEGKLGEDAWRLADLTVIWDEAEGQVHTVRDDARLRDAADRWADWDALFDEESFRPLNAAAA